MKVSAIVISTGRDEAQLVMRSMPALLPQVDELVVIANGRNSVDGVPAGVRVIQNEHPCGFSISITTWRGAAGHFSEPTIWRACSCAEATTSP